MSKVVVTGASGKAGRAVVRDLLEHEHEVLAVDVVSPAESSTSFLLADPTDFGQTIESLARLGVNRERTTDLPRPQMGTRPSPPYRRRRAPGPKPAGLWEPAVAGAEPNGG